MKKKTPIIVAICIVFLFAIAVVVILLVKNKKNDIEADSSTQTTTETAIEAKKGKIILSEIEGVAYVYRGDKELEEIPAVNGMEPLSGDEISLPENASLVLLVDDDKRIKAEGNAFFNVYFGEEEFSTNIQMVSGKLTCAIHQVTGSDYVIETSNVTITSSNAEFTVVSDVVEDKTILEVISGSVIVKDLKNNTIKTVEAGTTQTYAW